MYKFMFSFAIFAMAGWGCAGAPEDLLPSASTPVVTLERSSEVNLNLAAPQELSGLPHFTPELAQAVVADREQHGPFFSREELMRVSGVTESLYRAVRDHVRVGYCAGHEGCAAGQVCYFLDPSRPVHMGVCQPGTSCRWVQCSAGTVCTLDRSDTQVRPVCRALTP